MPFELIQVEDDPADTLLVDTVELVVVVTITATCHTEGCENEGVAVTLEVPDEPTSVWCGACDTRMSDVEV